MINLSQMTGAKQSVRVCGEEYVFSPINLLDIGIMQDWWQEKPLSDCQERLSKYPELYSAEQRETEIAKAKAEYEERKRVRNGLEIDREIIDRCGASFTTEFSSPEALAKLVYLSVRKNRPNVTEAEAAAIVSIEGVAAMQEMLDAISFPERDPDEDLMDDSEKKTA